MDAILPVYSVTLKGVFAGRLRRAEFPEHATEDLRFHFDGSDASARLRVTYRDDDGEQRTVFFMVRMSGDHATVNAAPRLKP